MIKINNKKLHNTSFIDLFAGIGGFRLALESFGAKCVYSSEWDEDAREVYRTNFGELPDGDITRVNEKDVPNHDILCAGFPCQAFSISGKRLGFEDSRGTLFFDVARIAKEKQPKVIFLENVRNFANHDSGKTLKIVINTLYEIGYNYYYDVLNAKDFGIPQNRERIYIVAFRKDIDSTSFVFPKKITPTLSLHDLLLEESEINVELYIKRDDIKFKGQLQLLGSNTPRQIGIVNKGGQGERIYDPSGIAITLSSNGGGVFAKTGGYLIKNKVRKLMPRECARVMGFPEFYKISPSPSKSYKQFGNSVVVDVIQYIAIEISNVIEKSDLKY